jgi:hypothetical protein
MEDRVSFLWDIYDFKNGGKKPYCRKNPFDVTKAALGLGSQNNERTAWSRLSRPVSPSLARMLADRVSKMW